MLGPPAGTDTEEKGDCQGKAAAKMWSHVLNHCVRTHEEMMGKEPRNKQVICILSAKCPITGECTGGVTQVGGRHRMSQTHVFNCTLMFCSCTWSKGLGGQF